MCLYRKSAQRALITNGDKIVYKRVMYEGKGKYKSEWREFIYEDGYHYINDNFPLRTEKVELYNEGLHSFSCRKDTTEFLRSLASANDYTYLKKEEYCLIECIIPYNTPYYIGTNGQILSRELIVIRVITPKRAEELIDMGK